MKFGENLKKLRKSKKLSQESLAEKIGVSRQSVSKWECGDTYPEMDNILLLCNIFHCKINELVHEELTDIDNLDKEVKSNIVKFKKEKQKQMRGLSKTLYIISRFAKIISIIGLVCTIITMIIIPFFSSNIKVTEIGKIEIFNEKIEYKREDDRLIIKYKDHEEIINDYKNLVSLNKLINSLENNSIIKIVGFVETIFVFLVITLVFFYLAMTHLEKLFINIYQNETPFTLENVNHIKKTAIFMIIMTILPNISGVIMEYLINENLGIGFELLDLIYILFLFSMAYIFEYGYEIQLDSKGKMYDDEK